MDCLFCKIIEKQIPAHIVYEDDYAMGVLDVHPRAPGHIIILPKTHAETILEVSNENLGFVFQAVKATTEKLKQVFSPDGFTIGINQGKASGQTVEHLHIHIIPRWLRDKGGSIHSVVDNASTESLDEIAKKIVS